MRCDFAEDYVFWGTMQTFGRGQSPSEDATKEYYGFAIILLLSRSEMAIIHLVDENSSSKRGLRWAQTKITVALCSRILVPTNKAPVIILALLHLVRYYV